MTTNDDEFDLQLKSRFAQADAEIATTPRDSAFADRVSRRILRLRRRWLAARVVIALILLPVAWLFAASLQSVAIAAADFSLRLTNEIGQLASTPAAFVCGVLIAVAAVAFATLSDD